MTSIVARPGPADISQKAKKWLLPEATAQSLLIGLLRTGSSLFSASGLLDNQPKWRVYLAQSQDL